jgi:hypothetical protein
VGHAWSPEQIAHRLPIEFPDDKSMRVCHETIYQSLFIQGRGALRRELVACLRTGRALRVPRARARVRDKKFVTPEVLISQRPTEVEDRAVPGHWEGDLILGLDSSAIGTLVERTTRFTLLLALPPMPGHDSPRVNNGPALAGHGAAAVRDAIAAQITTLPEALRRSLTWDQGAEMAQHAQLRLDTGLEVYFCDPHSPWQRGTNENTNGLLRQYFPRAPTWPGTAAATSTPWPSRSTLGRGRPSAGAPLARPWKIIYGQWHSWCCDDRLIPPNIERCATPSASPTTARSPRSAHRPGRAGPRCRRRRGWGPRASGRRVRGVWPRCVD